MPPIAFSAQLQSKGFPPLCEILVPKDVAQKIVAPKMLKGAEADFNQLQIEISCNSGPHSPIGLKFSGKDYLKR